MLLSTLLASEHFVFWQVSSISFSPHNGMLAVGSYSQTTVVYAESNIGAFVYLAWPAWLEKQITWIADNMMKISGAFFERWELSIYRRAQGNCLCNIWLVGHILLITSGFICNLQRFTPPFLTYISISIDLLSGSIHIMLGYSQYCGYCLQVSTIIWHDLVDY